jgi:two-component system, chemotaxis family, CheB/CheR fusion protein
MDAEPNQDFEDLLVYLKTTRGFDFTGYKRPSLMRRVQKRASEIGKPGMAEYLDYLQVHPDEFAKLFDTILINVTTFFRDPETWEFLKKEVIPAIAGPESSEHPIRVWSAGCAAGHEAYSIAILLSEHLGPEAFQARVKIYGTDVDEDALSTARHGTFSSKDLANVSPELQEKYFEPSGSRFVFQPEMRRSMIFGRHDLVQDAPISRINLVLCRNTLMYFNAEAQTKILARLHFALKDDGFLFLGKAEMVLSHAELFQPFGAKQHIFTKVLRPFSRASLAGISPGTELGIEPIARLVRLRDAAMESAPVAQLLVDVEGRLIMVNEQARALFNISLKDLGRPLQDLEISYRPLELRSKIEQAFSDRIPVVIGGVQRVFGDGETQFLNVQVAPLLDADGAPLGVLVSFVDASQYHKVRHELERSRQELETAYEELQSTNEELETTNEELQSTVEELETTNEELQSSNEELETMNEELQSTNAELQATNEEMRERTDELDKMSALSDSVMGSLKTGVTVLDKAARIESWNRQAEELWGVRSEEALGTPFFDLDIGLPVRSLKAIVEECLSEPGGNRELILDAVNRRGQKMVCRVKASSLIGAHQDIDGVVLLMELVE